MPFGTSQASDEGVPSPCEPVCFPLGDEYAAFGAIEFNGPIDTSTPVPEYPLISRALMLPGGSTDADVADVNGDGYSDMVIAVGGTVGYVSLFYGQSDGEFLSYPSYSISLGRKPVAVSAIDIQGTGQSQIAVLEKANSAIDTNRLIIINLTSESSHEELKNLTLYDNATSMAVGNFIGDFHVDIAIACAGSDPSNTPGVIEVREGPSFATYSIFEAGKGTNCMAAGDFDGDLLIDIAVGNRHDSTVAIFNQPFSLGMDPSAVLEVDGSPSALASGRLNDNDLDDLVVCTDDTPSARFFFQDIGGIPLTETYNRSLQLSPSHVTTGDVDQDGRDDLLVLSVESNAALGMLQRATTPIWPSEADFIFPTGAFPRSSLIGHFDSDEGVDIAIASARDDWNGSSLALYLAGPELYSNGNVTILSKTDYEAEAVASGDIDDDDFDDVIFLYPAEEAFGYRLSSSGDLFTIQLPHQPAKLNVADLNADGISDVLTTEAGGNQFIVHLGNAAGAGNGTFDSWTIQCSGNLTDLAMGDLNDDALTDIAVVTDKGMIDIFYCPGPGLPFEEYQQIVAAPGESLVSIAIGDFDSNGLNDIAYPRATTKISVMLQNEGSTPFSLPADYDLSASFNGEFEAAFSGDITGDGKDDILGLRADDNRAYLFDQLDFATTSEYFEELEFPEDPIFVTVTDATDDGFEDIVAIFESADLVFLYRQEDGTIPLNPSMTFVTGANPSWAVVGDGSKDHRGDLIVCNSGSHSASVWEQLNFAPTAHSGGPYEIQQGDDLVFNGSATTGSTEIPFMEYRWDFGDGNSTTWIREPNPVHAYMELDVFDVTMEVRDPLGLSDTSHTAVTVVDSFPHVSFTMFPSIPMEGAVLQFNDTTTSFDEVILLNWSVDGAPYGTNTSNITVAFDDGPHYVTLEATDDDNSVANFTLDFNVLPRDPQAVLVAPSIADEGVEVRFEVEVDIWNGGPWDDIVSYEWNFSYEGGEFVADIVTTTNSTFKEFGADGESRQYSIAVRVTDDDGNSTVCATDITILDIGPDATLVLSTDVPGEGVPFSFLATDSYDGVVDWAWTLIGPEGYHETFNLTASEMAAVEFVLPDGSYEMHLEIAEADNDTDEFTLDFDVAELPPSVTLHTDPDQGTFLEFEAVSLTTTVDSYDEVTGFEWDFIAYGGEFMPDAATEEGTTYHQYDWAGNYTVKVRVTDSENSTAIAIATVEITDRELAGTFDDVAVTRDDPNDTATVTFDASYFSETFPDISNVAWEFGDGDRELLVGVPSQPISHTYSPVNDYIVNLTLTDDDGNVLIMSQELLLVHPVIEMISPAGDCVINPGIPIRFLISDDSLPLVSVTYSVDDDTERNFTSQYEIDTTDWADGTYSVTVRAQDRDGNIAILRDVDIAIDSVFPEVAILWSSNLTYAGDRLNLTIEVDDANVDPEGVTLFIRFPGDDSASSTLMKPLENGRFYAVVNVPMRTGTIEFWFTVEDMAENAVTTEVYSITVRMHFIDAAWPYLLALAIIAAMGTAFYFFREAKTAVDETFIIYNDGRLMAHSTRRLKPGMDDQILGSMFVAIQDFVKDSFKGETSFTLRKLDFGEKSVLVERGDRIFLAAVLHGRSSRKVVSRMKKVVNEIEERFEASLEDWDGDLDEVRGVNEMMKKLYSRAPAFPGALKRA
ncbi:MAG: VCBS repeat-containing protein [Methanobacteriota archaeon]|nr:MAG: VCBS repeat-containing protein [Euryarchaeota archaeon]